MYIFNIDSVYKKRIWSIFRKLYKSKWFEIEKQ